MRSWMIAFSAGIVLAGWTPQLPQWHWIVLLSLFSVLLHCSPKLRLAAAALGGVCWFLWWAHFTLQALWPDAPQADEVLVQGTIWSLPQATEQGWRFTFLLDTQCAENLVTNCVKARSNRKLMLSVYQPLVLMPGQRWQFLLRLHRPHGFSNPGGFDYEAWLLQQDISASGYVRESSLNRLLASGNTRPWFHRLRYKLLQQLQQYQAHWQHTALLRALTLGDKSAISAEQWLLFASMGLNHLMVISGLHIALVAAVMFRCGAALARVSSTLLLRFTAPRMAAVLSALAALCYAGLAGFTLPALRALVMVLVYLSGIVLRRQTHSVSALGLALLLVLLLDPLAPQSAGFWLSFVAVSILLLQGSKAATTRLQALWQVLRVQLLLCIGMLPVMLIFFQQSSALAPLVNLLAIPFVGMLVVPLALLGLLLLPLLPTLGIWVLNLCDLLLAGFMWALQYLHEVFPAALLSLSPPPTPVLVLVIVLIAVMLWLRHKLWLLLCITAIGLLLRYPRATLPYGELELSVLDVGQGLAIVVTTAHQDLLYDTGPRYSASFDAGSDVVLPALRSTAVRQVDRVLVSHADLDHAGGLAAIEAAYPRAIYSGSDTSIFSAAVSYQSCSKQHWEIDGSSFTVLHPLTGTYSTNNGSCVLLIETGGIRILLPGDIERPVELEILERYPDLHADILIAPHHGSNSSSSSAFIKALQPRYVVYSAGYQNRFHHPAEKIIRRYERAGVRAFNTAYTGALTFHIAAASGIVNVSEYRREHPRFWYLLPANGQ